MDRKELQSLCKEKNVYQYQIAHRLNVSEPTFIRWMRYPVTGELEDKIRKAIDSIVSDREQEGSSK